MGVGRSFCEAYGKAQLAAGNPLPHGGRAFISVRQADKGPLLLQVATDLLRFGFELVATRGTAQVLADAGIPCAVVNKVKEGRPHIVDMITNGDIAFVLNTTEGKQAIADSFAIRAAALRFKVPYTTTLAGARATCLALQAEGDLRVESLHRLHIELTS
jgi:carbamoyl-phosphate synthase large subunit